MTSNILIKYCCVKKTISIILDDRVVLGNITKPFKKIIHHKLKFLYFNNVSITGS